MDSPIVPQEEISPHKSTATFHALEGPLFGICICKYNVSARSCNEDKGDERDLSCLDLCSERLKALLQYVHLYFFSPAVEGFRTWVGSVGGAEAATAVAGIVQTKIHTTALSALETGCE